MTEPTPTTRADARRATDTESTVELVAELSSAAPDFLPLGVRRALYLVAIAALAAGPVVAIAWPELATAITTAGSLLGSVALGTALANPTR